MKKNDKSIHGLCGWCGKPLPDRAILLNGEWICYKCKRGHLIDKCKVAKLREGVNYEASAN